MFCANALFCANELAGATNALAHRLQDKQDPIGAVIGINKYLYLLAL